MSLPCPGAMGRPPVHIAYTLLDKAHPTDVAASMFTDKVIRKPLHLRPTSPEPLSQDARERRRHQRLRKQEHSRHKQKPKPLSAKEKRISGIYDIPNEERNHEIYVPLHKMWLGYMREVLGLKEGEMGYVTAQGMGTKLTSADYHGAEITVVRSKCVSMVGLEGIVVRDTKFTFQIITKKNDLKIIPKKHTIFHFEIPQQDQNLKINSNEEVTAEETARPVVLRNLVFELHGSQFENRAIDRATKKFKQRSMSEL